MPDPAEHRDFRVPGRWSGRSADANGARRGAADGAAWIWHPDVRPHETAVLRFALTFDAGPEEGSLTFQVTADQRFQLRLDGELITVGPDYSDPAHWSIVTCQVPLSPGPHRLEALVWWLADGTRASERMANAHAGVAPPMTQMTIRGGFLFAAEGWAERLSTGRAPWQVVDLTGAVGFEHRPLPNYHDIGPAWRVDLGRWNQEGRAVPAAVICDPVQDNPYGLHRPDWRLHPTDLPEQRRVRWSGGRIRAVTSDHLDRPFQAEDEADAQCAAAQALLRDGSTWVVPARSEYTLLWDCEDYVCGYPALAWSGGAGAAVEVEWAEALYEAGRASEVQTLTGKGNRDAIRDKVFLGFGDTFLADGERRETPPLWWRAGRYLRVRIRTGLQPLKLERLAILTTGYPLDPVATWRSSDPRLDAAVPLLRRALLASAHEVWADSPFYEQLPYVGDNVIECLAGYVVSPDDRLCRRAIELFDWSRSYNGLVAERYPSRWPQSSTTYALLWPTLVQHQAWWRDDAPFVRRQLPGVRALLEQVFALVRPDGLLGEVPGWSFVDWVPAWAQGVAPGAREGDSSILNLHVLRALRSASALEQAFGERELFDRYERRAGALAGCIRARYWDAARGLVRDTTESRVFSEHAQCLALLGGLLDSADALRCHEGLLTAPGLTRCTVYFQHYLFEALALMGGEERLQRGLDFWRGLPDLGFRALPEAPEPSRSDCHGWSAHALFHLYATVAGIRPAEPGFRTVMVRPQLGSLSRVAGRCVHPRGTINFAFAATGTSLAVDLDLPAEVDGLLRWRSHVAPLHPGANRLTIGA